MARYTIYHPNGTAVYTGVCHYTGTYLQVPYIEFSEIASPVAIDWEVGDYVDYGRTGLRYVLSYIPQPERRADDNKSGEAFVYRNVQLHDATKDLERVPFWDYVLNDNNVFYSSRPETTTYENVYGIANRIQQCLTQARTDGIISNTWEVHVLGDEDYPLDPQDTEEAKMLALLSEPRDFSINGGSILDCLKAIYNTWDLVGWLHLVDGGTDIIVIGKPLPSENGVTRVFQYGRGLGLSLVVKSHTNLSEMATRLYVFGSSKNMLPGYYRNDPTILNSESNDIERLMIPKQYWGKTGNLFDPHKAYIDAKQGIVPPLVDGSYPIEKYGIIVRRVDFDGGGNEEVYPTISGITAGIERAAYDALTDTTGYYRANPSIYPDAERLDELKNGGTWTGDDGVPVSQSVSGDVNETITPTASTTTNYTFRQYIFVESGLSLEGNVDISFVPSITVSVTTNGFTWARRTITLTLKDDAGNLYRTQTAVQTAQTGGNLTFTFNKDDFSGTTGLIYGLLEGTLVSSSVISPSDEVSVSATGTYTFNARKNYSEPFTVTLKQIGFDISKFAGGANNIGRLEMKDGGCGGRSFSISSCTYNSATDDWTVTCQRSFDSSLNQYFPNESSPLATGDHFVLSDIIMPGMYVAMAEQRLYQMGVELLKELCVPKFLYEPEIDAKVVLRTAYDQNGVCQLKEGKFFQLYDESLKIVENASHTDYFVIDTLEIREGESNIPTYKVTLLERKTVTIGNGLTKGTLQTVTKDINDIYNRLNNYLNDGASILRIAYDKFLRKDTDDVARGKLTFMDGFDSSGAIEGAQGLKEWNEGDDAHMQVDYLTVLKKAIFNELEIRKLSAAGGNIILSPSASKLVDAIPIYDENDATVITGWKCHLLADDGTMATTNNWVVGDQAKCQTFNLQQRNNAGTVANRYYWRVVTEVGDVTYDGNGEVAEQAYIVLSNVQPYYDTGGAGGTDAPAAGDTVVQEGFNLLHWLAQDDSHSSDDYPSDRSNVILLESSGDGTPRIAAYKNIDAFSIDAADLVFSQSPNSVIFNSANFTWQTPSGDSLPQIMDRGEWSASATYNKYDRVSHNGDLYVLQVDGPISGAASEPGVETSGYWLQQTSASAHYAYLSNYADNITVDADGNVIGGLWTEDENENRQYRISAAVYAKRGDSSLEYDYSATGRAAAGKYKVSVIGDDCTVTTTNGTIFVTAVAHVKDGVAGSGSGDDDWEDEDYILMRGLQVFRALITIDFEGKEYQTIEMPVQVHHTEESYIGADLTNPMAQVAWNPKTQSFVGFPVTGQMRLWQGSNAEQTALSLTSQSYSDPSGLFSVTFASPVNGTYSIGAASGSTDSIPDGEYVLSLTGTCKVAGVSYERTQEVRIVKSTAEVVYSLMPSATVIYQTFTGGTSTLNPATFTVDVMATDANGTDALTAAAVSAIGLSVTVNGTAYTAGSTITPSSSVDVYNIALSLDGAQLDVDTIPVLLQGSDGEDGTDVEFAYCRQTSTPTKPAKGAVIPSSGYYTINGCKWYNHPQGITASNPTEWVSMRKSINDANGHASFANSIWTTPTKWSQWGETGKDGDGVEYIFARTANENTAPSNPLASWDYDTPDHSYGWYDDPQGVTASLAAEWVSQRKSVDGVYKNQAWSSPSLWSKYANKGSQGDGVEYIYARTANISTTPSTSPSASWAYGQPDNTTGWYAVPQGVNTTYKAEWVCQRTSENGEYAGRSWNGPTLWCNLSEDGDPVPGDNAIEAFADPGSLVLKMTASGSNITFSDPANPSNSYVDAIIKIRDGATVMTSGITIISRTAQGCGFGTSPSHPTNGVRVRTVDVTSASIYNPLTEENVSAPVPVTAAYVDVVAQYNGVNYNVRIPVNCDYSSSLSQLTTTSNNIGAFVYDIANGEDGHGRTTGINITAGTIAAIADNFILYGSDGETPAVYWDTTAGNYIFNGTIYADAGHFGPLSIATYPWGESYIATPVFVDEGGYSYRTTLAGTEFNISATFGSNTERVTIAPFGDPDRVDTNGVIDIHARAANYPAIYVSQGQIFANGDITSASNITATGAVSAVGTISAGGNILAGGFVQGRMAANIIDTSVAYTLPTSYFNSFVRVKVTNNPNITVPNGTQNGQWLILVFGGACTLKIKFHSNASYTSTTIPSGTFTRLFFVWYDGEWHQISRE